MNKSAFQKGLKDGIPIGLWVFCSLFYVWYYGNTGGLKCMAGCIDLSVPI